GPAEDAHVGVDAHEDDVVDVARLQQIPDLHARVADRVALVHLQDVGLALPRGARVTAQGGELGGPVGVFGRLVVLAAVGLVDGVLALLLGGDPAAPRADVLGQVLGGRGVLGPLPHGGVLVRGHARAGGVDDQDAALAQLG